MGSIYLRCFVWDVPGTVLLKNWSDIDEGMNDKEVSDEEMENMDGGYSLDVSVYGLFIGQPAGRSGRTDAGYYFGTE